jgi:hypothetical protein
MNFEQLSGQARQLAEAQGELTLARDDLELANDRIRALTEAIGTHLTGPRDLRSFLALRAALRMAPAELAPETGRYSVLRHGSLGAAIIAERNDLRDTLRTIQAWDCLNPPRTELLSNLSWLKRVVDEGLDPDAMSPAEALSAERRYAAAWKRENTWNLSYEEFLHYAASPGADGKGAADGSEDLQSDPVYTSPEGSVLTRAAAQHWCQSWQWYLARRERERAAR